MNRGSVPPSCSPPPGPKPAQRENGKRSLKKQVFQRRCKLLSRTCGGPAVVQAVVRYVRWPRGGASYCPVRALAPRWCKLLSGTCAGPAVVQAVIRCLPVARRSFVLARCARSFSRSGGGTAVVQAALRCLPVVRRWCFHVFYEVSALGKLKLRLAIFQAPRPGEAVPEKQQKSLQNASPEVGKSLQNASRKAPGGQPRAGAHF